MFTDCDFSGVDMAESEHVGSAFRNCTFRGRRCGTAPFVTAACWARCSPNAGCGRSVFEEVDFTLAVLGDCDLRGADLSDCRLSEASLVKTDLRKAVLRRADLRGARTQDTRLDEADLRGARVDPTLWTTASLRGAKIDIEQALAFAAAHGLDVHGE